MNIAFSFFAFFHVLVVEHPGDGGVKLPEAVLSAKKVQFDAFRLTGFVDFIRFLIFKCVLYRSGVEQGEFQISMDCTYRPNDVVPIIGKMRRVFLNLLQTY